MVDLTTLEKYRDRDFERRYYGSTAIAEMACSEFW